MPKPKPSAALALAVLATGCGAGGHAGPRAPSLYTDVNAHDVWLHPQQHLGARIDVRGTVRGVTRVGQGVVLALSLPGAPELIATHVFDRHFRPRDREAVQVIGLVRGSLGSPDVPGVPLISTLEPGTTVIDALAATIEHVDATPAKATGPRPVKRANTVGN